MNPAYSVILFTTASGAGYGLLALLGLVGAQHGRASSLGFALVTLLIALALITVGLLSSTMHLGRPERAWRAFSQWRSSWLSREGIAAVLTYPVALAFGAAWAGIIEAPQFIAPLGIVTAIMCAITVYCTGMIYQSLRTIRQWYMPLVTPTYLLFALATGAALLAAIATVFGRYQAFQSILGVIALLVVLIVKWFYWREIDAAPRSLTTGKATGLGENVRMWEVPHTNINFVQKEMGYAVARKHALKLRKLVQAMLIVASIAMALASMTSPYFSFVAAVAALAAAITERWLFFAEAEHVSMLYYGRDAA